MIEIRKPKHLKGKGRFEKMACLYIFKCVFIYMFCQRPKLRKRCGFWGFVKRIDQRLLLG